MGCHYLLWGIFPIQGSNPHFLCLLNWQVNSLSLVPPGKPLVERKVCFISDAGNLWGRAYTGPKANSPPHPQLVGKSFYRLREGLHAETAQSALTVILKLVSGLTSVILIVLNTVSLQLQDRFVSISLRSVLGIVAA